MNKMMSTSQISNDIEQSVDFEEQLNDLTAKCEAFESRSNTQRKEKNEYIKEVIKLEEEKEELNNKYKSLESKYQDLEQQNKRYRLLASKLDGFEEDNKQLQILNIQYTQKLKKLYQEKKTAKQKYNKLEAQTKKMGAAHKKKIDFYEKEKEKQNNKIVELLNENELLKDKLYHKHNEDDEKAEKLKRAGEKEGSPFSPSITGQLPQGLNPFLRTLSPKGLKRQSAPLQEERSNTPVIDDVGDDVFSFVHRFNGTMHTGKSKKLFSVRSDISTASRGTENGLCFMYQNNESQAMYLHPTSQTTVTDSDVSPYNNLQLVLEQQSIEFNKQISELKDNNEKLKNDNKKLKKENKKSNKENDELNSICDEYEDTISRLNVERKTLEHRLKNSMNVFCFSASWWSKDVNQTKQ